MKHSRSYFIFVIICLALFAAGFYLRDLRKSNTRQSVANFSQPNVSQKNQKHSAAVAASARLNGTQATPGALVRTADSSGTPILATSDGQGDKETSLDQFSDRHAFSKIVENVKKSIPSNEHLREVGIKNLHETPIEIADAAMEMGRMSEALEKHPEFAPEAQNFYQDCSVNSTYPTSIRASCYADLQRQLKRQNLPPESFPRDGEVPTVIKNLAKKVL